MEADGPQDLVCIRAYGSRAEAEYAQALLASQGIACELAADGRGRPWPGRPAARAGIRLLVSRDEAGDADEILADVIED